MRSASLSLTQSPNPLQVQFQLFVVFLLLMVVLLTHGQSLRGEFLLDDTVSILENPSIRSLTSLGTVIRGDKFTTVAGRPVLNLSLALNYAFGGVRPSGYHLFNYGVHTAAAFFLFCLLRRILATFTLTKEAAVTLAFATSVLWCVHPLTINGVSYIVQRAESMTSLCYLAAMWGFVKGVQTSKQRWFIVSISAAWLGSLTKETIATVPATVIALDVLVMTRDWRQAFRSHWAIYFGLMSSWIPLALCMSLSQSREGTVGFGKGISLLGHCQTQVWAVAHYLCLIAWPQPLVFDYGPEFVVTDAQQLLTAAVVLTAFLLLLLWLVIRHSPLAFPGVAFCLLLAPTSAVPIVTQTVAEHRMYLASVCGIVWIVLALYWAFNRLHLFSSASLARQHFVLGMVLVPLALTLATRSIQHTKLFLTEESIWTDTLLKHPTNQRAYYTLAFNKSKSKGGSSAALRLCDQGIALQGPLTRHLYEVRGTVRAELKQLELAYDDFSRAIAMNPEIIDDRYHRAAILRDLGRFDEALDDLNEARRIDPANLNTDLVLGSIHAEQGELDQALECFDRLLTKAPNHVAARRRRAALYAMLNRWTDASQEIRRLQQEGRRIDEQLVHEVDRHLVNR